MGRLFDIVASTAGLAITLPLYPFIALAIRLESAGPVFYRQRRVGRHGREFVIWKFRTMADGADRQRSLTVNGDDRITGVGQFLRRWKLDELPTLMNVLSGEMSVVGPRAEVPRYVDSYTPEQRRVLDVRPGITDPATLDFVDEASLLDGGEDFEDVYLSQVLPAKLRISLEYIECRSVAADLRVIWRTVRVSLRRPKHDKR